jgi:localization factor PodJL
MTSAVPWSVKGIDPKTREIAKDLARRSGMTLGEWLTHVISEDNGDDAPPSSLARKSADRPASENRTPRRGGDDIERVLETLQDLSQRFDTSAREQAETTARFEHAIAELKADQDKVSHRLRTASLGVVDEGKVETLRALEGALNKVAGHLAAGEGRQREALATVRRELGEEMARVADQMNRRVLEVEDRGADAIAQVGAEVTRVASVVELRLRRADDVQAEALEKLGAEIARITERLSDRISASERRAASAVEDVGEQVGRMADRIHARQERNESELVERMRQSEDRTAKLLEEARQTIDRRLSRIAAAEAEPAAPVSLFAGRWAPVETHQTEVEAEAEAAEPEHHAALAEEAEPANVFAERWAQLKTYASSVEAEAEVEAVEPEHHAAALEEADLVEAVAETAFLVTPEELVVEAEAIEEEEAPAEAILEASYDGLTSDAEQLPYADADEDDHEAQASSHFATHDDLTAMQAVADAITTGDLEDEIEDEESEAFAVDAVSQASTFEATHDEPEESLRPSTRDLIAEAKAAAFAEHASYERISAEHADDDEDEPGHDVAFTDFAVRKPRSPGQSMRGTLLAVGAAASVGLAGAGLIALHPEILRGLGRAAAKPIPVGPPSTQARAPVPTPAPPTPQAAVALATTTPEPKSEALDLDAMYRDAVAKVDQGDASGLASLRTAANLGYAPAQRRLGKLYEDGGAGLDKDPKEGRLWTTRAAANGDARAMHNLGLDYYEGSGGPKNLAIAAQWFQRAAELGLRDSQYNLARFMEAGIGVPQDLQGAYRWYLIAARAGDTEAQARAGALKAKLPADQQTRAQALAGVFQPDPASAPAPLAALLNASTPKQLALAQRALGKLGYYKGADDGAPSQQLGEAIQSYQRERGLASNGRLSPELLQTFANLMQ